MKSLQQFIKESILDDDLYDKSDLNVITHVLGIEDDDVSLDENGCLTGDKLFINRKQIPVGIKIGKFDYVSFYDCKFDDLSVLDTIDCNTLRIHKCEIHKFSKRPIKVSNQFEISETQLENTADWFPTNLEQFTIKPDERHKYDLDFSNSNITNITVNGYGDKLNGYWKGIKCSKLHIGDVHIKDLSNFEMISVKKCLLVSCKRLTNLKGIGQNVDKLEIGVCSSLKSLEGLEDSKLKDLVIIRCSKLDSNDYLPNTLREITVTDTPYECWLEESIREKYPHITTVRGTDPRKLKSLDPSEGGKYKPGMYGVTRSKGGYGKFGQTRGTLTLDKISHLGKARIGWEKAGFRDSVDCIVFEGNPNPNKDWTYTNPGFNDITGVGIEIGDKVAVYLPSGSFGKNNGLAVDEVVGFTPSQIKLKNNKNRYGADICILRSQKIAKQFYQ